MAHVNVLLFSILSEFI